MDLVLGVLLVHLVPALGSPEPSVPVTAALLLALVALVALVPGAPARAAVLRPATGPTDEIARLPLTGRVTDPVHHPRRPRAPGPA